MDIAQSNIADNYLDGAKKRNQDHFGYFVIREILEENKINITSESGEKNKKGERSGLTTFIIVVQVGEDCGQILLRLWNFR